MTRTAIALRFAAGLASASLLIFVYGDKETARSLAACAVAVVAVEGLTAAFGEDG